MVTRLLHGAAIGAVIVSGLIYFAVDRAVRQTAQSVAAIAESTAELDTALGRLEAQIRASDEDLTQRLTALERSIAAVRANGALSPDALEQEPAQSALGKGVADPTPENQRAEPQAGAPAPGPRPANARGSAAAPSQPAATNQAHDDLSADGTASEVTSQEGA